MIDYIVYIAARSAIAVISSLPLSISLWIGRVVGMGMYHLHPKRKKIAYSNIKAAFSSTKTPSELKGILKSAYLKHGQNIIENASMGRMSIEYLKKYVTMDHAEYLEEAGARGKGMIFLTSHFGNWDISGLKAGQLGYGMHALYRPFKNKHIDGLIAASREKLGCKMIGRGMGIRHMIRALRDGGVLGMVADQDAGKAGVYVDLLGRPASHAIGTSKIARDTGASIVPSYIVRQNGPYHDIKIEKPFTVSKTDDKDRDIKEALEKYAAGLEKNISKYPDEWMWGYTRWKSTPKRNVVILSDGKQGHLNQSLAALEVIKRCRRDAGFTDNDTRVDIIEIKYKSGMKRRALALGAFLSSHTGQGDMRLAEACLEEMSYEKFSSAYADIVISCGSSLVWANLILKRECNAKNVVMMKPGAAGLGNFNVAVIPEHDRPARRENVAVTKGAPGIIGESVMSDGAVRIAAASRPSGARKIGLFLGGDSPGYALTADIVERLIGQIKGYLEGRDIELLVTTSRRTPKAVEVLLKERFASYPRCGLLLIANEKNIKNAVGGILGLSDIALVSGESISMVSEAASSGKKTIVFDIKSRGGRSKHDAAIERLASEGYIMKAGVGGIGAALVEASDGKFVPKKLDNDKVMYEKLLRVI
jgi:KDO2-lipid IV(A) lauroyltransferase